LSDEVPTVMDRVATEEVTTDEVATDKGDMSQTAKGDGPPSGRERRRYERVTVLWQASLQLPDKRTIDCVIVNISASGAMVQLSEQVACRGTVFLSNTKIGTFSAEPVWHEGNRVGLQFNEEVEEVAEVLGDVLP